MAEKTTTRWLEPRGRLVLGALCVAGIVIFAVGLGSSPGRVWRNLLVSNFLILGGSVVGILFIALQYVARAGWATVIRRVPEAMSGYIPVGAALMALLMLGVHSVYPWAHGAGAGGAAAGHDAVIEAKAAYLNVPAFILRTGAYLFLWWAFARVLVRRSRKQDESGDVEMTHRNVRTSVLFIILLAVSFGYSIFWFRSTGFDLWVAVCFVLLMWTGLFAVMTWPKQTPR